MLLLNQNAQQDYWTQKKSLNKALKNKTNGKLSAYSGTHIFMIDVHTLGQLDYPRSNPYKSGSDRCFWYVPSAQLGRIPQAQMTYTWGWLLHKMPLWGQKHQKHPGVGVAQHQPKAKTGRLFWGQARFHRSWYVQFTSIYPKNSVPRNATEELPNSKSVSKNNTSLARISLLQIFPKLELSVEQYSIWCNCKIGRHYLRMKQFKKNVHPQIHAAFSQADQNTKPGIASVKTSRRAPD